MNDFNRNHGKSLRLVKQQAQDFEWYPTTNEIIKSIQIDILTLLKGGSRWTLKLPSVLDCGAGDGRVLKSLSNEDFYESNGVLDHLNIEKSRLEGTDEIYAIEKSATLLQLMSPEIMIVGTDFHKQTLLDKEVSVTYCNPPFSEFAQWAVKIICESLSPKLYFVLPKRWAKSKAIKEALSSRNSEAIVLKSFDFYNADRQANTEVDLIRVDLDGSVTKKYMGDNVSVDPFAKWFDDHFQIGKESPKSTSQAQKIKEEIVKGGNPVEALVEIYNRELGELTSLYSLLGQIDTKLLSEINISQQSACGALKLKIKNLKNFYWAELFSRMDVITNRLTVASRDKMLKKLFRHNSVDFDLPNAYAVVEWACKNADLYIDEQLIELFQSMLSEPNVKRYKSNSRLMSGNWKFNNLDNKEKCDYLGLDYRLIMEGIGVSLDKYCPKKTIEGMSSKGTNFLNNLRVIAYNLGFDTFKCDGAETFEWGSRTKHSLKYFDHGEGVEKTIFDATTFKNQNIWLSMNRGFLAHLNVEMGRLMGWLTSAEQAAEELDIPLELAQSGFNCRVGLPSQMRLLIAA